MGGKLMVMPLFFDPHVCQLPILEEVPEWLQKTWRCPRCGWHWHLEHFRSEDGARHLGCSWILEGS
jgi:hypothetical protein